jgi:hypothetical protein
MVYHYFAAEAGETLGEKQGPEMIAKIQRHKSLLKGDGCCVYEYELGVD